ncbi:MAG TPA: TetR/AcrR family transcriptional regulator [Gemmatimonadales bacterium]
MPASAPPRRGAATRARLISAALELFATRGYHATTTALLAERTRIAEGTIYRHFPGKDALYSAVCRSVWERLDEHLEASLALRLPTRDRLADAARNLVRAAELDPAAIRLQSRPLELAVLDDLARDARLEFRDHVTQLVAAGKQEGAIRAGAAEWWGSLWLAVVWSTCERVAGGELTAEHPNVGLAIDAAWDMVRSDRDESARQAESAETTGGSPMGAD